MRALILTTLLLAGCSDDPTSYLVVTVDRRPAVHDADTLKITLSNSGSMRTDDLSMAGREFPVTFSISAPGRTGDLGISIDALSGDGGLVGHGTGATTLDEMTAMVTIDSADFVVNNEVVNNQFLSNDFEAVGLQLATITNGTWMAVYRDDCMAGMCSVFGRRFDPTGLPVQSTLSASPNQFPVSTRTTSSGAIPAIAASGATTLVLWDYFDSLDSTQGVACRVITDAGAGSAQQLTISGDSADVVTATGLANGNFAVTWQTFMTTQVIRSVIVKPDCTTLAAPITVSTGTLSARRSHVAASSTGILYAWIVEGQVHVRPSTFTNALGTEAIAIAKTASDEIDHVRIAPYGTGFAIAVRWAAISGTGPGKIEVYRANANGQITSPPTVITDKSGSDFASDKAFGIAARKDGALLVTWHVCETGPGSCEVYGRVMRPTGVPVGEEFVIPTSRGSDQINPSAIALDGEFVAAWNDSSGVAPDQSGSAVRARILYPPYDDARGIMGALCGPSAPGAPPCGPGLACATGSDAVQRCFATCTPPSCPGGGTCSTVDATTSACTF